MERNTEHQVSPKSRLVVALVALFMGLIGIHRFYIGKTNSGIAMLSLFLAGWSFIWIFPLGISIWIALSLWAIIDIVKIFRGDMVDADGLPVSHWR